MSTEEQLRKFVLIGGVCSIVFVTAFSFATRTEASNDKAAITPTATTASSETTTKSTTMTTTATTSPTTTMSTTTTTTTAATTAATTTVETTTTVEETVEDVVEETYYWYDGPVLTPSAGVIDGPSGRETYYNLDMSGVLSIMYDLGYNYTYWVRSDGVKMFGDYVMVAADLNIRPRGSLVETSLGTGIVVDTGGFIYGDCYQLDIATCW